MKHINRIIIWIGILAGLTACENFDREFDDYLYTSGYFPYQYPVRTLILGDYIYDNSNDNAHKFLVSVAMGGVYENKKDRAFNVVVDESLCNNLLFTAGGNEVKPLPSGYYTLSSPNEIVIKKGAFNGGVEVQLTEAFFNDPSAIENTYVVPMRITGSTDVDTIIDSKNYTLFAVKYINEYHGTFFYYGHSNVKDPSGTVVETNEYNKAKFVEDYPLVKLKTTGRYQVSVSLNFHSDIFSGSLPVLLTFSGNQCTITSPEGAGYTVTGKGEFKSKEYTWGNKERNGIVLDYTITNEKGTYTASDVLVERDRGVVMEVFSPVSK